MNGRPCWVCGAPESTKEHVWPQWLQTIVTAPVGKYRIGVSSDPAGWREWIGATFEQTSRVLCGPCNSRLGKLEGEVAPIISAMAAGQQMRLYAAEQQTLAQWMYKTGLMVSTTYRHDANALPKVHYSDLAQSFDLPPASAVWISQVQDPAYQVALYTQRFYWHDKQLADAPESEGYFFALSIGEVAGVVAVLDVRQSPESTDMQPFLLTGQAPGRLFRIWPSSKHYGVSWPPATKLTAADFQNLADSFQRLSSDPTLSP